MQKKTYWRFIGLLCIVYFCNAQKEPLPPIVHVTVHNNQANQTTASSVSNATAISYAWFSEYCKTAQEAWNNLLSSLKDHLWQHKIRYSLYCLVGTYAGLVLYTYQIDHFMHDPHCWHTWSDNLGYDALYALDYQSLVDKLNYAIQKKYFDHQDPMNKITPIVRFFTDIRQEKKLLERYNTVLAWLEKLGIAKLPFVYVPAKEKLLQAQRHLLFLEQIATTWCLNRLT